MNEVVSDGASVKGNLKSDERDKGFNGPWHREPAVGCKPVHSISDYHL